MYKQASQTSVNCLIRLSNDEFNNFFYFLIKIAFRDRYLLILLLGHYFWTEAEFIFFFIDVDVMFYLKYCCTTK